MHWCFVTGEYPPTPGGVSDYTRNVAEAFAQRGETVTVCAPAGGSGRATEHRNGVRIEWLPGHYGWRGLRALRRVLQQEPRGRLLLQYVPHAFGMKAMNIPVTQLVAEQKRHDLWVMFHEVAFPRVRGQPWQHRLLARVHPWMAATLLRSARQIFVSTLAWTPLLETICGRPVQARWAPIPSSFENTDAPEEANAAPPAPQIRPYPVVGHFGTFGNLIGSRLEAILPALLERLPDARLRLIGRGSREFSAKLEQQCSIARGRITAMGEVDAGAVAGLLRSCDLMVHPYPDGVSTRRTSTMSALAVGCPVLTEAGPLTEPIWAESGAVHLMPEGSSAPAWAAAAGRWLDASPAERKRLGEAGRELYCCRFSLRHTVDLFLSSTL